MRKKYFLELIPFLIFVNFALGQETKIYNGNFNTSNFTGIATYDYIESEDERIFSGNFNFKTKDNSLVINGSFLNNKKHGNWEIIYNNANVGLIRAGSITAKIYGRYNEGNLEGKWVFDRKSSILTSGGKFVIDKSIANFQNNNFSGNFTYESNISQNRMGAKNVKINGSFDDNGFCHGVWTLSYVEDYSNISHIQTMEYKHGLLVNLKEKNLSTGETKTLHNNSSKLDEFFSYFNYDTNEAIIGDKVYSLLVKKDGSREDVLKDFSYGQSVTSAFVNGNCEECEDLDETFSIWCKEEQYNDLNYLGEFNKGIYEIKLPFNNIYIDGRKTSELQDKIYEEKQIQLEKERKVKRVEQEKRESELQEIYEEKQIQLEKERKVKRVEQEKREYIKALPDIILRKNLDLDDLYSKTIYVSGHYYKTRKKKAIFEAYLVIYNYPVQEIEDKNTHLINLYNLQKKLEDMINKDTKDLKKQLKGISDYHTILDIILNY